MNFPGISTYVGYRVQRKRSHFNPSDILIGRYRIRKINGDLVKIPLGTVVCLSCHSWLFNTYISTIDKNQLYISKEIEADK